MRVHYALVCLVLLIVCAFAALFAMILRDLANKDRFMVRLRKIPGLYFIQPMHMYDLVHISRTMIEGCETECGMLLTHNHKWKNYPPQHCEELCSKCVEEINALPVQRGLAA